MKTKTDWDQYYRAPFPAARWSRQVTTRTLLEMLDGLFGGARDLKLAEMGGANSCFLAAVVDRLCPAEYHIIDSNALGLSRTTQPPGTRTRLRLHQADVLALDFSERVDCVFSVGLIEHFDVEGTRRAVRAHFDVLKPGGIALISFPTATPLYRTLRWVAEIAGLWMFPDERPLTLDEVTAAARPAGEMLTHRLIWKIGFTQRMAVFRKHPEIGADSHAG